MYKKETIFPTMAEMRKEEEQDKKLFNDMIKESIAFVENERRMKKELKQFEQKFINY